MRIFPDKAFTSCLKHLDNYQNLAQVYIKKFERKLDEEELVAIKSRVEVTKEAADAAFTRASTVSVPPGPGVFVPMK